MSLLDDGCSMGVLIPARAQEREVDGLAVEVCP